MNNKERGKYLRNLREERGISQQELANKINYTRQNLSKWENGIAFPSDNQVIKKIADVLQLSNLELKILNGSNDDEKKNYSIKIFIIILAVFLGVILIIIFYINRNNRIFNISFNDGYSGVFVNNFKERYLNLYIADDIKDYQKIYLYTVYNNNEMPIFETEDKFIRVYEKHFSNEYNLKYITKCGLHSVIFYKDNHYEKYDYYLDDKKTDETCNYEFVNLPSEYLNNYGFTFDGFNYHYVSDDVEIIYDGYNYRIDLEKNDRIETLESMGDSQFLLERYVKDTEKQYEKIIKINGLKNCNEEVCSTFDDYAKFINFLIKNK